MTSDPAEPDPAEPDIADLVMRTAHHLRRRAMAALEPWNVAPHEMRALRAAAAAQGDPLRLSEIAERLRIAPRSATEVVDALEAKGLATRTPSPTDRRAVLVVPTDQGTQLLAEFANQRSAVGTQLLAGLSGKEKQTLIALLTKVTAEADGQS